MQKGILFIVSGPSGSGKGTILNAVYKNRNDVAISVSATTRSPRIGEQDGVEYRFLDKDVFLNYVKTGEMLEYNEYCGNFYGTLKQDVNDLLQKNEIVVLEVDVNGAQNISKVFECVKVFILPPSLTILKDRLLQRKTENEQTLKKRLTRAYEEVKFAVDYDYIVVNDDISKAICSFNAILDSQKCKSFRMKSKVVEFLNFNIEQI